MPEAVAVQVASISRVRVVLVAGRVVVRGSTVDIIIRVGDVIVIVLFVSGVVLVEALIEIVVVDAERNWVVIEGLTLNAALVDGLPHTFVVILVNVPMDAWILEDVEFRVWNEFVFQLSALGCCDENGSKGPHLQVSKVSIQD